MDPAAYADEIDSLVQDRDFWRALTDDLYTVLQNCVEITEYPDLFRHPEVIRVQTRYREAGGR